MDGTDADDGPEDLEVVLSSTREYAGTGIVVLFAPSTFKFLGANSLQGHEKDVEDLIRMLEDHGGYETIKVFGTGYEPATKSAFLRYLQSIKDKTRLYLHLGTHGLRRVKTTTKDGKPHTEEEVVLACEDTIKKGNTYSKVISVKELRKCTSKFEFQVNVFDHCDYFTKAGEQEAIAKFLASLQNSNFSDNYCYIHASAAHEKTTCHPTTGSPLTQAIIKTMSRDSGNKPQFLLPFLHDLAKIARADFGVKPIIHLKARDADLVPIAFPSSWTASMRTQVPKAVLCGTSCNIAAATQVNVVNIVSQAHTKSTAASGVSVTGQKRKKEHKGKDPSTPKPKKKTKEKKDKSPKKKIKTDPEKPRASELTLTKLIKSKTCGECKNQCDVRGSKQPPNVGRMFYGCATCCDQSQKGYWQAWVEEKDITFPKKATKEELRRLAEDEWKIELPKSITKKKIKQAIVDRQKGKAVEFKKSRRRRSKYSTCRGVSVLF